VSHEFKLVLEGLADDSPDSLRKVKGALLADLGLTVPEAQRVLSSLPFTLFATSEETELIPWERLLHEAGARVTIVRPKKSPSGESAEPFGADLDFTLAPIVAAPSISEPSASTAIIESSLDFFVDGAAPLTPSQAAPQPPPNGAPGAAEIEFSLELQPAVETAALKETLVVEPPDLTPIPAPAPVEEFVAAPPRPVEEPRSAEPPPAQRASPTHSELHHAVPLGRRTAPPPPSVHGEAAALRPLAEPSRRAARPAFKDFFPPDVVGAIIAGAIILGIVNWLVFRL